MNFNILVFTFRPLHGIVFLFTEEFKVFPIKARALAVYQHSPTKVLYSDLQQYVKALVREAYDWSQQDFTGNYGVSFPLEHHVLFNLSS